MLSEVISINNISATSSSYFGTISGNTFFISALNSAKNIIIADATVDALNITNNIFRSSLLSLPITFTVPLISISGDNCYVALNSIENITYPSTGAISFGGNGSSNILNKGENYKKLIPISSNTWLSTSNWAYKFYGTSANIKRLTVSTSTLSSSDYLFIDVNSIPDGAVITSIGLYYFINSAGATVNFSCYVVKADNGSIDTTLGTFYTSSLSTVGVDTYVSIPASMAPLTFEIEDNCTYYLRISVSVSSGSVSSFDIHGIDIRYTL